MKIWTAVKRVNHRYDAWAMHTANKVVDALDHRGEDIKKPRTKKHLSVWDLLPNRRDPSGKEDLMRFIDADWKAWPARNVDDLRSPAQIDLKCVRHPLAGPGRFQRPPFLRQAAQPVAIG